MSDPYADAKELADLFGRFEYALKRGGFLANKKAAEADWGDYADALGEGFFNDVVSAKIADTLINDPPRKLLTDGAMPVWQNPQPAPLANVRELIVQGVCRVRNSFIHGEKFTVDPTGPDHKRDGKLVAEALAVLRMAQPRDSEVAKLIPD